MYIENNQRYNSIKVFFISFFLLMFEVFILIGLMILANPLKKSLPIYFFITILLIFISCQLLLLSKKSNNTLKQLLIANFVGMIWWTITEICRDVFNGAVIEDKGGIFLLMIFIVALYHIWQEIQFSNLTAILTFLANWLGHIILETIMYFRNPENPYQVIETKSFWNIVGFSYGIFSIMAAIAIVIYIIIKKPKIKVIMILSLAEYVMILNIVYVFIKHYFPI